MRLLTGVYIHACTSKTHTEVQTDQVFTCKNTHTNSTCCLHTDYATATLIALWISPTAPHRNIISLHHMKHGVIIRITPCPPMHHHHRPAPIPVTCFTRSFLGRCHQCCNSTQGWIFRHLEGHLPKVHVCLTQGGVVGGCNDLGKRGLVLGHQVGCEATVGHRDDETSLWSTVNGTGGGGMRYGVGWTYVCMCTTCSTIFVVNNSGQQIVVNSSGHGQCAPVQPSTTPKYPLTHTHTHTPVHPSWQNSQQQQQLQ